MQSLFNCLFSLTLLRLLDENEIPIEQSIEVIKKYNGTFLNNATDANEHEKIN